MGKRKIALYHAFHTSLPIMAGYGFLGLTYGIYMHELGFNFLYPMLLAITVYAGSAEFLLGNMLLGSFHPLQAFLMVLIVNARHLFYGLSMLEEYKGLGWKKFFLIFDMSDYGNLRRQLASGERSYQQYIRTDYLWIVPHDIQCRPFHHPKHGYHPYISHPQKKKSMTLLQQIIIVSAGVVASHLESAYHITTVAEEG